MLSRKQEETCRAPIERWYGLWDRDCPNHHNYLPSFCSAADTGMNLPSPGSIKSSIGHLSSLFQLQNSHPVVLSRTCGRLRADPRCIVIALQTDKLGLKYDYA